MCSPTPCRRCGKTTWTGCGQHAEQVMAAVPKARRCQCPPPEPSPSWLGRLFGR